MHIAVFGAGGRLGTIMVSMLAAQGVSVTAIARRENSQWPKGTRFHPFEPGEGHAADLSGVLAGVDGVLNAAPLADAALHRAALAARRPLADIGIAADVIKEIAALDPPAREAGVSIIGMAGLIPGLAGLVGQELVTRHPDCSHVDIGLFQRIEGTAGVQGAADMLDLLTRPEVRWAGRYWCDSVTGKVAERGMFDLPNAENAVLPDGAKLKFATAFDSGPVNRLIGLMRGVRAYWPGVWPKLRGAVAGGKRSNPGREAAVDLSFVVIGGQGGVIGTRAFTFSSDYGVTTALAAASLLLALEGRTPAGAGHLSRFISSDDLLAHPMVAPHVLKVWP